jgi:hypothetical protein
MIEFAPRSENKMTYDEAILYCQFCNHDGHIDWRMPTYMECAQAISILHNAWYIDMLSGLLWWSIPVRDV